LRSGQLKIYSPPHLAYISLARQRIQVKIQRIQIHLWRSQNKRTSLLKGNYIRFMIIRNRTSRFMFRAIGTSKTETSFLLLISNLSRTKASDFLHRFFEKDCLPDLPRRIYRNFCHCTGRIADNHFVFNLTEQ